jgi:hypothetical protein
METVLSVGVARAKNGRRHGSVAEAGGALAVGVALLLAAIALGLGGRPASTALSLDPPRR